jgi:TPR repeat protein
LTGDGVGKNLAKAKAYLKQAADQGSPTAIQESKTTASYCP